MVIANCSVFDMRMEEQVHIRNGNGLELAPAPLQGLSIGRYDPGSSRLNARAVVDEKVFQCRIGRPCPSGCREKRCAPVVRAFKPTVALQPKGFESSKLCF